MGRRPRDLDTALMQAEDLLRLAKVVKDKERHNRMVKYGAALDGQIDNQEQRIIFVCHEDYVATVNDLVEAAMTIAHNPLFWSEAIPLAQRAGLAVLLNSPLKPERVDA